LGWETKPVGGGERMEGATLTMRELRGAKPLQGSVWGRA